MISIHHTALPEVVEIRPKVHGDARGYFMEAYNAAAFRAAGIPTDWVQDNQSMSAEAPTLRGLHYQDPPMAQAKLVRVLSGRIHDVIVDIRRGSPNYLKWIGIELSAKLQNQLLVPAGFAHGFVSLEPDTVLLYKVDAHYSAAHDRSIRWDDPDIGVDWPLDGAEPVLSEKDRTAPFLADLETPFVYPAD